MKSVGEGGDILTLITWANEVICYEWEVDQSFAAAVQGTGNLLFMKATGIIWKEESAGLK